jgi:hypothetical protein
VLAGGQATLEEAKSLAATVLEQDGQTPNQEISAIAEKAFAGGQVTLEETKSLAAYVIRQNDEKGQEA